MPSIPQAFRQGLASAKPTADRTVNQGWLYYETDTPQLVQSWNDAWVPIVTASISPSDVRTVGVGGVASILFSAIPTDAIGLRFAIKARSLAVAAQDFLKMVLNGDSGANYQTTLAYANNAAQTFDQVAGATNALVAVCSGSTAPANAFSQADVFLASPNDTHSRKSFYSTGEWVAADAVGSYYQLTASGEWKNNGAITSVHFEFDGGLLDEHSIISMTPVF